MRDFHRKVDKIGDHLTSAGWALETLSKLLGGDGLEHNLAVEDTRGLLHAVRALGETVRNAGYELCDAVEDAGDRKGLEVVHAA